MALAVATVHQVLHHCIVMAQHGLQSEVGVTKANGDAMATGGLCRVSLPGQDVARSRATAAFVAWLEAWVFRVHGGVRSGAC
jgi:hypothetical protein